MSFPKNLRNWKTPDRIGRKAKWVRPAPAEPPPPLPDYFELDVPLLGPFEVPVHWKPVGRWTKHGTFPSVRSGREVVFWGDVQEAFLTLAEADPRVVKMRARPTTVEWFDGTHWRERVPDFEILHDRGATMVDVAQSMELDDALRLRRAGMTLALKRSGVSYRIFTKKQVMHPVRLSNASFIADSGNDALPALEVSRTFDAVARLGRATISQVAEAEGLAYGNVYAALLQLAFKGRVSMAKAERFGPGTLVSEAGR